MSNNKKYWKNLAELDASRIDADFVGTYIHA